MPEEIGTKKGEQEKMLTIIRGLPGSGKSTKARELAAMTGAILIEPDMLVTANGKYCYTADRYRYAVEHAQTILKALSYCDWSKEKGYFTPDVIYADVLPTAAEVNALLEYCGQEEIRLITLEITLDEARARNIHHVREEDLRRMAETFEQLKIRNGKAVKK